MTLGESRIGGVAGGSPTNRHRGAMSDTNSSPSGNEEERWKPPFMPWFEADFSGAFNVRKLKPMARLMYRSLLQQGWHSDNPPYLPNRDADLMLMADAPSSEIWEEHKTPILERLKVTGDGLWLYHPKALREYDRALSEHQRKVAAGGKRWRGGQVIGNSNTAGASLEEITNSSTAEQEHSTIKAIAPTTTSTATATATTTTNKSLLSKPEGFDEAVEEVWDHYLKTFNKNSNLYRFTDECRRKGRARMKECIRIAAEPRLANAVTMMKLCVDRLAESAFHNGGNKDNKKYVDWSKQLFGSEEKLISWLDDDIQPRKKQK